MIPSNISIEVKEKKSIAIKDITNEINTDEGIVKRQ